jgi:hypothetical protein
MCQGSCSMGFSLDRRSLETCALDVSHVVGLQKLWQEVVNLKMKLTKKK